MSKPCEVERAPEHGDRFVVDAQRYGEGMAVLATVCEREASGVVESSGCPVHDLRNERERL